jgi:hypothetical protein
MIDKFGFKRNTTILNGDGIEFLSNFTEKYNKTIDLLFLDAWDVGHKGFAQRHLDAYLAAKNSLSEKHIILIDDTDVDCQNGKWVYVDSCKGGKGAVLIPYLLKNGYSLRFKGRQTLLVNF